MPKFSALAWRVGVRAYRVRVDFRALVTAAQRDGWASGSGDIDTVRIQAAALGWTEVATRRGDPPVSVLRPTEQGAAHPMSLSAQYGLGQQPLHTDGAHLSDPPEIVVLVSSHPSKTPTLVWKPDVAAPPVARLRHRPSSSPVRPPLAVFMHGMFLVHSGRDSFYTPVFSGEKIRYDPGCMTPCDARARQVEEYFADQHAKATEYEWVAGDQVLVVDNRQVLHARAAVTEGDAGRELTRVVFREKAAK